MMTDVLLQPLSALFTELGDRFGGFRCFDTSVKGFAPHAEAAAVLISVLWAVQFCENANLRRWNCSLSLGLHVCRHDCEGSMVRQSS